MDEKRETVAVVGLGASGEAAARLALAKGAKVHVTDADGSEAVADRGAALRALGADLRLGGHSVGEVAAADTVVVSPGIPPGAPLLAALRDRGVAWVSEPEFACRFISGALTVVTGTNGKTTTAALCAHLLREAGVDAALGGNVGGGLAPAASGVALLEPAPERVVLELSSFQLAGVRDLTPAVGVMTNLGVDHLDRYASVREYHRDKRRMFEAGDGGSVWVLNGDDGAVMEMAGGYPGGRMVFSVGDGRGRGVKGAWLAGGDLVVDAGGGSRAVARAADLPLLGRHNLANALAALLAAAASGGWPGLKRRAGAALRSFRALPHRLELVGAADGVTWVNDSKATNVGAARSALESLDGPLVVLVGGVDKGEDFGELLGSSAGGGGAAGGGRVRAVIAYGEAGGRAAREIGAAAGAGGVEVARVDGSFGAAVAAGLERARRGDALLLSPACSSFDMFADYRERGEAFRALARERGADGGPGAAAPGDGAQ